MSDLLKDLKKHSKVVDKLEQKMTVIQSFKRKNNKDGSSVENDKRKGNMNLFATVTSEDSEVSKDSDEDK